MVFQAGDMIFLGVKFFLACAMTFQVGVISCLASVTVFLPEVMAFLADGLAYLADIMVF